ncbi:hypothetical protein [Halobacterium rubrum]|uniref:hypothetical protein n=1 Tax=Halobacterium TaxID=2239 RepID=UPI001F199396|nr:MULTISPECIES: hypothetical protein [Halobacterium]MDH5019045.1 hypothetical protein [Halobacterium rubrum]
MTSASKIDREELRSIADEGLMTNPYNEFETLVQKVETLKTYLVRAASDEREVTYGDVSSNCGIHPTRRGVLLGFLGIHEDRLDDPPLPAIVVSAEDGKKVGDGYWVMVEKTDGLIDVTPDSEAARRALWCVHRNSVFREWGERQAATR